MYILQNIIDILLGVGADISLSTSKSPKLDALTNTSAFRSKM